MGEGVVRDDVERVVMVMVVVMVMMMVMTIMMMMVVMMVIVIVMVMMMVMMKVKMRRMVKCIRGFSNPKKLIAIPSQSEFFSAVLLVWVLVFSDRRLSLHQHLHLQACLESDQYPSAGQDEYKRDKLQKT